MFSGSIDFFLISICFLEISTVCKISEYHIRHPQSVYFSTISRPKTSIQRWKPGNCWKLATRPKSCTLPGKKNSEIAYVGWGGVIPKIVRNIKCCHFSFNPATQERCRIYCRGDSDSILNLIPFLEPSSRLPLLLLKPRLRCQIQEITRQPLHWTAWLKWSYFDESLYSTNCCRASQKKQARGWLIYDHAMICVAWV